jgi:hypothetical protein
VCGDGFWADGAERVPGDNGLAGEEGRARERKGFLLTTDDK